MLLLMILLLAGLVFVITRASSHQPSGPLI
jgi:hypothetical protein